MSGIRERKTGTEGRIEIPGNRHKEFPKRSIDKYNIYKDIDNKFELSKGRTLDQRESIPPNRYPLIEQTKFRPFPPPIAAQGVTHTHRKAKSQIKMNSRGDDANIYLDTARRDTGNELLIIHQAMRFRKYGIKRKLDNLNNHNPIFQALYHQKSRVNRQLKALTVITLYIYIYI